MTLFPNKKAIGSFLSLMLVCGAGLINFNSCSKDSDEPKPGDDPTLVEDPTDEENKDDENKDDDNTGGENNGEDNNGDDNGEDNNGEDNNGDDSYEFDVVPSAYIYPLSYVVVPNEQPQQVKEYTSFTVNFNKNNHTPNYVAWELLASETTGSANRNDYDFWWDNSVEGCSKKDYQYSQYSYQRGHMCPAADNKWSAAAMKDCMSMANMAPQYASLNEKAWGTLENNSREWAKKLGALWIICGPNYDYAIDTKRIGVSDVLVPSSYFKAFLYLDPENPANSQAIGFVFPNGSTPGNLYDYAMSIDNLEQETGFDFFFALPDSIENEIEASFDKAFWQSIK